MTGEGPLPGAPAQEKRKGMLVFYVTLGAVFVLAAGLCVSWPQLRLRYAIYQLKNNTFDETKLPPGWSEWLMLCTDAARRGNPGAMDALINQGDRFCWAPLAQMPHWPAQHRAAFYRSLRKWPRGKILEAIHPVAEGIDMMDRDEQPDDYLFDTPFQPIDFVKAMGPLAGKSGSKRVREAAGELLTFVKEHFAAELAEIAGNRNDVEAVPGGAFPGINARELLEK